MKEKTKSTVFSLVTGGLIAFFMIYTAGKLEAVYTLGEAVLPDKYIVVIDAGHGGDDPGKIGCNNVSEKDINLIIAGKVKSYLEAGDVDVVMTRESDAGLYDPGVNNKKVQDMKRRIEIMDESQADLAVSIHQNSYPEESVHGAQVFYYTGSIEGQKLADFIQKQFVRILDPTNKRQIKADSSYYLLKKASVPVVIAECGFLSNYEEAEKLSDEDYQNRVAWAVYMGIMNYLNSGGVK